MAMPSGCDKRRRPRRKPLSIRPRTVFQSPARKAVHADSVLSAFHLRHLRIEPFVFVRLAGGGKCNEAPGGSRWWNRRGPRNSALAIKGVRNLFRKRFLTPFLFLGR